MKKYAMGIDFGTLSGHAVIVNIATGEEMASAESAYAHAVMSEALPCGKLLPVDYALQHPQDYLDVLGIITKECIEKSDVKPEDIIGVGIDFTAATVLPVLKLCGMKKQDIPTMHS